MEKLTVIYYHDIVKEGEGRSYQKLESSKFEEQMAYLRNNGYTSLFLNELSREIPHRAVLVTFDDGFKSVYHTAAPILKKYGIKGNVFLATKYIDKDSHFMTWIEIEELYQHECFDFGAHTHEHIDIRAQDNMTMKEQVNKSNQLILKNLGYVPDSFCMPYGKFDAKSIKCLKSCSDYKYIFASYFGQTKLKTDTIIPRIGISNDDSIEVFRNKLLGKKNWKGALQLVRLCASNIKKEYIDQYEME